MLLRGQGLLSESATTEGKGGGSGKILALERLMDDLGFVQLDTINVIERAHHLTLWSRLEGYRHSMLTALLEDRRSLFEHWTHDASVIPIQHYPHWQHRFDRYRKRIRTNAWWRERLGEKPDRLLKLVRSRIIKDGPLLSRDFEHDGDRAKRPGDGTWWGWKPQKAALEHLWRCGELAVAGRVNFQKVYDLAERVFPDHHAMTAPAWDAHVDWACRTALTRLGAATTTEIAAYWRAIDPAEARKWCAAAAKHGEIEPVLMEAADGSAPRAGFAVADWRKETKSSAATLHGKMRLLNPFDPVLRDRARTKRLFNFDYSFEAFVPAAKRRYGYYVMPIMEGDRFVGRFDPKFHRDRGVLEIKNLWWEPNVKPTKQRRATLVGSLENLAAFIGAKSVNGKFA